MPTAPPSTSRRAEYDESDLAAHRPRRRVNAAQAIMAVYLALFVGGCLGSGPLVGLAERQEFGTERDVALTLAKANDRVAHFFWLNRPGDLIDDLLDDEGPEVDVDELLAANTETTAAGGTSTGETVAVPTDGADADAAETTPPETGIEEGLDESVDETGGAGAPVVEPVPTAAPARNEALRTPTAEDPLRVWVGGDSMSREVGFGVQEATLGQPVTVELGFQISSGLSRPDFFDWPQQLAQLITRDQPPEAVVIMFGANDWQDVEHEGQILERGSAEWLALYRERVTVAMDLLNQTAMTVTWVGQPIISEPILNAGVQQMNAIYADEASRRPWITYLDTTALFADANGNYTESIDGTLIRDVDGVHLAGGGPARMGNAVWATTRVPWGL